MKYYVSAQHYWPDGEKLVEIAYNGLDYSGPDMVSINSIHEGEYDDPKETAEAAIALSKEWTDCEGIAIGGLAGDILELRDDLQDSLKEWQESQFKKHWTHCDVCADPMPKNGENWENYELPETQEMNICTENCCDTYAQQQMEEQDREFLQATEEQL